MRQFYIVKSFIESLVDLLRQRKGIDQSVLTGGSLTGHHRPHFRARSAGLKPFSLQIFPHILDLLIGNALDLQRQPGCHGHFPRAVFFRRLRDALLFLRRDLAVSCDHTHIETVRIVLILQTAKSLHPLYILLGNRRFCSLHFHFIKGNAAFQHFRIGIAISFQPVLQKIPSLALCADKQKFCILLKPFHRSCHFGEI